jgi:hypothetical protein
MIQPFAAFTAGQFLKNSGDSGDKPEKPSIHEDLQPVREWGQSGDKKGTEWGHFYMMKNSSINLSFTSIFLPFPSAFVLASFTPNRCIPYRRALHFAGIERERAFPWHKPPHDAACG